MRYIVSGEMTISVHCYVEADSEADAREKAADASVMTFCHQCSNDDHSQDEWRTSGELDGEPRITEIEERP